MRRADRTPASLLAVGLLLTAIGLVVVTAPDSCAATTPRPAPPRITTTPRVTPPPSRPATPRFTSPTTKTPTTPAAPVWYAPIVFWESC